jgi:hypothetical protein
MSNDPACSRERDLNRVAFAIRSEAMSCLSFLAGDQTSSNAQHSLSRSYTKRRGESAALPDAFRLSAVHALVYG